MIKETIINHPQIEDQQEPDMNETERIFANPVMTKRLSESIRNIERRNIIAINQEDLWK